MEPDPGAEHTLVEGDERRAGMSWLRLVLVFLAGAASLAVATAVVPWLQTAVVAALTQAGGPPDYSGDSPPASVTSAAESEAASANQDNFYVALWFARCLQFKTIQDMPQELVDLVQPYGVSWMNNPKSDFKTPSALELQVSQLSRTLYRQRIADADLVHQ